MNKDDVHVSDRAILSTDEFDEWKFGNWEGLPVEITGKFRDTIEVMRIVDPGADMAARRLAPPGLHVTYDQISELPRGIPLDMVGPYEDSEYDEMNFECPDCGFAIAEWTDCPECGWYDEGVWEATMTWYVDCVGCEQTVPVADVHLCDDCEDDYTVIESKGQLRDELESQLS